MTPRNETGTPKLGMPRPEDDAAPLPFWKARPLEQLSRGEWESLCDGCGRCCLVKLEDEDTGEHHFTEVACALFDTGSCRCHDYARRSDRIPDCVRLDAAAVRTLPWLPATCAYRLVAEERDLYWWHPLVSGSPDSVHQAGISVRGKVAALEQDVPVEDLVDYIVSWPNEIPAQATAPSGSSSRPERRRSRNAAGRPRRPA